LKEPIHKHRPPGNPVLVEVWRGEFLESLHRGAFAVVAANEEIVFEVGDIRSPIYPRSAIKPVQALALVESGALRRFGLDDSHVCLASASHAGEVEHARRVETWLQTIGLDAGALECGAHRPYSQDACDALVRSGIEPTAVQNNCSGKHCGYLTVARHFGEDYHGYIEPDHPVQRLVTRTIEEVCDWPLAGARPGVDGCGVPVHGIPLRHLAVAFAAFSKAPGAGDSRSIARATIRDAILRYPRLIAGQGQFCTRVIEKSAGSAILKSGAEGVLTATLLEEGIGIAVKIDDGAKRAAEVLMASILQRFTSNPSFAECLADESDVAVRNVAGRCVGRIRTVSLADF
jgi:L-asparaginase II